MKKFILFAFCIMLFSANCNSQSGWFWQNPKPQGNHLQSVLFNSNVLISIGNGGAVIRSTNRGDNWININLNTYYTLKIIKMINQNTGFIIRSDNVIYKTTNSGLNWDSIYSHNSNINNIFFKNLNYGLIISGDKDIYSTNNGGHTWSLISSISLNNLKLTDGAFFNDSSVICVGYNYEFSPPIYYHYWGRVYKSGDNGLNWTNVYTPDNTPLRSLDIISNKTGFIIGSNSYAARTTNSGTNWSSLNIGSPSDLFKIKFLDSLNGYTLGKNSNSNNYYISKTKNGGSNWQTNQTLSFNDLAFLDTNTAITVSNYGDIYKTTNSGLNWISKRNSFWTGRLNCIVSISDSVLLAGGNGGNFLKSTDSGKTWFLITSEYTTAINAFYFLNDKDGFAVLPFNILRTTNGGLNWVNKFNGTKGFESVYFQNLNTGYLAGRQRTFMKTTNGGDNWSDVFLDSSNLLFKKVLFVDQQTGYVLAINWTGLTKPTIFKTTDNGSTWNGYPGPLAAMDLYFLNQNTGFSAGYDNEIYKTTNGGINWITTPKPAGSILNSITFINQNTGYIVGYFNSAFLKTTNCGNNWYVDDPGFVYDDMFLYGVTSHNGNATYVGEYGMIKSTRDVNSVFIKNIETYNNTKYFLRQNYPNPFNPTTKIKFDVVKSGNVKIVVYDVTGREIQTLVNEKLQPGTYETTFDGSGLTSGIYFYRMTVRNGGSSADGYSETKKMVYLK